MRYRPLEIAALAASRARVFVLVAGNLRGAEIAWVFLRALPEIYQILRNSPGTVHRADCHERRGQASVLSFAFILAELAKNVGPLNAVTSQSVSAQNVYHCVGLPVRG